MNLLDPADFDQAVSDKVAAHADAIYRRTDRMFLVLMPVQWIGGIIAALLITPKTWIGAVGEVHPHVMFAVFGGAILCSLPMALALVRPGRLSTRVVIGCSQV